MSTAPGLLPSWPRIQLQVAFNRGANDTTTPLWSDLTSRMIREWSITRGRQYEIDAVQTGELDVTLSNTDGALDPTNTTSPYYPGVLPYRPCRMLATWPPSQNLLPQNVATGTAAAGTTTGWATTTGGTLGAATGLTAAPSGQTTACSYTYPASTAGTYGYGAGDGTLTSFATADSSALAVTAGLSYTASGYQMRTASADTTVQAAVQFCWYNQAGTLITTTTGAAFTLTTSGWTRATCTGTAPAGSVWCRLQITTASTTTASNTIYATGLQLEQAAAVTGWADPGVTYSLFQGYVERWPQLWEYNGTYGEVQVICVDAFALLAQLMIGDLYVRTLEIFSPDFIYPLNEGENSSTFADATGAYPLATVGNSPLGPGTIASGQSIDSADNWGGYTGSPGPIVSITQPVPTSSANVAGSWIDLGAAGVFLPPPPWTRQIAFRTTTTPPAAQPFMTLWVEGAHTWRSNMSGFEIYLDTSGHLYALATGPSGSTLTVSTPYAVNNGNWHLVTVTLSADGKTLTMNVDNVSKYTATAAASVAPAGTDYNVIGMFAESTYPDYSAPYTGDVALISQIPTALDDTEMAALQYLWQAAYWNQWFGNRFVDLVSGLGGYTGPLNCSGVISTGAALDVTDSSVLDVLQTMADSENGQLFVDAAGTLQFYGRSWRYWTTAPSVVFGEDTSGGEIPYQGDIQYDFDPTHIYNLIRITQTGARVNFGFQNTFGSFQEAGYTIGDLLYSAQSSASKSAYGVRSLDRTLNIVWPDDSRGAALYYLSRFEQPTQRLNQLVVDGSSYPAAWPQLLSLDFETRARVMRRPPAPASAITLDGFVERLEWHGNDSGQLTVQLQMSPVDQFQYWALAPLHTTLAAAATAGSSTITIAALPNAATDPAAANIGANQTLVVGYGTAAAETVTVTAVAATNPGYTSVVLTLAANLTNSHSAGDTVCEPMQSVSTIFGWVSPNSQATTQAMPPTTPWPTGLDAASTLAATSPVVAY